MNMRTADPGAKDKQEERPKSTGKAYQELVEDLFMGDSSDDEEVEDDTE